MRICDGCEREAWGMNGHLATMAWVWADPGPDRPQPPLLTEGNDDILASVTEVNP